MMPKLSDFKSSVRNALKVQPTSQKLRSRRQVITFNEALENIKTSQKGVVICAGFHSFGRCRKEIKLPDSNFVANLDQLDLTDIQTPVKLMPLMLCSTHWGKTVYHNALFLDWLSSYGSKQDHPHFENTVVDYQSAIALDIQDKALSHVAVPDEPALNDPVRPASTPGCSTTGDDFQVTMERFAQLQIDRDPVLPKPTEPEPELEHDSEALHENSVIAGMEYYASIESGVANLEIMYREDLKCIAMTLDGWRCQTTIQKDQLLRAREVLNSYATSGSQLDIELLPSLVLCPGHGVGDLPRIYSEKWATFSGQRLPKEEAMSNFNAEFWMNVQFFPNDNRNDHIFGTTLLNRSRSASNLASQPWKKYFGSTAHTGGDFLTPLEGVKDRSFSEKFDFSFTAGPNISRIEVDSKCDEFPKRFHPSDQHSPQSAPKPAGLNVQLMDKIFASNHVTSFASEEVLGEVVSQEQGTVAQNSPPIENTRQRLSQGFFQQCHSADARDNDEQDLVKEMGFPCVMKSNVYVLKSLEKNLCKIGSATNIITRRLQIQSGCQLQDFDQLEVMAIPTAFPDKAMKLIHLELQKFRVKLSCSAKHHREYQNQAFRSDHGEWFDVAEEVATRSVTLWCDFIRHAYSSDGTIKTEWAKRLTLLPEPGPTEISLLKEALGNGDKSSVATYHSERANRYCKWLLEGIIQAPPVC